MDFSFKINRHQVKGIISLFLLLLIIRVVWNIADAYYDSKASEFGEVALSNYLQQESFPNKLNNEKVYETDLTELHKSKNNTTQPQGSFNPNTSSFTEMIATGLPERVIKRIVKYREKGGKFYKKEKLQDFGLTAAEYAAFQSYIVIDKDHNQYQQYSQSSKSTSFDKSNIKETLNISINTADAETLEKLQGIGPVLSKRIINFRNAIGGFVSIQQIAEVYGLPDSTFQKIKSHLFIDSAAIHYIHINTVTLDILSKHPYIKREIAKNIIEWRKNNGDFKKITDLHQVPGINDEKFRKIVPYIKID